MSTTLLIVDFSAVFWRHWHASASEALTFARKRTVEHVRSMAASYNHTIVALDSPNCWRLDLWPQYKATRPEKDEASLEQMRLAQRDLEALYPCVDVPRWEADDVIAELVLSLPASWHATILTADKDLVQLLAARENVDLWHLAKAQLVTAESAEAQLGIPLRLFADYLALIGDKSDNVLGGDCVGPKRAVELLTKHRDIVGIYDALSDDEKQFTPALRAALRDARDRDACSIMTARKLVWLGSAPNAPTLDPQDLIADWKPPTKETNTVTIDDAEFDEPAAEAPAPAPTPAILPPPAAPSQPSTKAIVPSGEWTRALEPRDTSGAYGLAKVVVNSRMFSGYGTPEAAMLVIMAGREFGLGAMASLRSFHVVEGKPTMSAQAMMARCLEHPSCKLFRVIRSKCTHEVAVVEVQRRDWSEPETYTWTAEDAKRAGLANRPNWSKYPRDMLINRCIAEAARFTWPEVMAGVYSPEDFGGAS